MAHFRMRFTRRHEENKKKNEKKSTGRQSIFSENKVQARLVCSLSSFVFTRSLFLSDTLHTQWERDTAASINENILLHHTKDVINCCLISIQGMHPKHSLVAIKWYKYMFYNCTLIICREERQQQTDDSQCRRAVCENTQFFRWKIFGAGLFLSLSIALAPQLSSFIDLYKHF